MEDKITRKELYQELWKGRDLELANLWQRSILLMTYLVIAFTAYCGLWALLFTKENSSIYELLLMDFGFIFVSFFGLVTSILWIMMSKGSKYWYEKYEGSISKIIEGGELYSDEITNSDRYLDSYEEGFKLKINPIFLEYPVYYPRHGYLANIADNRNQVNNCLISTKAGTFSVSKVNIGIGIVTGWLWILLMVLHIFLLIFLWGSADGTNSLTSTYVKLFGVFLLEVSYPAGKTATSLLIDILPKGSLWVGVFFPVLFFGGFAVMCWRGLFSSSESKILKRRELIRKITFNFPKKEDPKAESEKEKVANKPIDLANKESDCVINRYDLFVKYLKKASEEFSKDNAMRKAPISEPNYYSQWSLFFEEDKKEKLARISKKLKGRSVFKCLNYRELCYVDTMLKRVLDDAERVNRELEEIK